MEKTKTVVKIAGTDYALTGYASEEYLHNVAIYVNRKMEEIAQANPKLSTSMLAVLTSLNIADELLQLREQQDQTARLQMEASAPPTEIPAPEDPVDLLKTRLLNNSK